MNTTFKLMTCTLLCCGLAFVGCSETATDNSTKTEKEHVHGPDGHSHDDGDHSHDHGDHSHGDGDHSHDSASEHQGGHTHGVGPHGGEIADWGGGKYHIELIVDRNKKTASIFVLGDNMKDAVAVGCGSITLAIKDPTISIDLKATPQEGDADGKTSCFVGTHDELGSVKEFAATVSGLVDGTPYSGNFNAALHEAGK